MENKKVILDVDTGSDDALAIMAAVLSEQLDIVAVCTVAGMVSMARANTSHGMSRYCSSNHVLRKHMVQLKLHREVGSIYSLIISFVISYTPCSTGAADSLNRRAPCGCGKERFQCTVMRESCCLST